MTMVVGGETSMDEKEWQEHVKDMLKAELTRRHVTYRDLAEKLQAVGVDANARAIRNKLSRGGFSAVFFFQCLKAIGCRTIHLDSD
jgi:hypothetical protein